MLGSRLRPIRLPTNLSSALVRQSCVKPKTKKRSAGVGRSVRVAGDRDRLDLSQRFCVADVDHAAPDGDAGILEEGEGARQRLGGEAQLAGQEALLEWQPEGRRRAVAIGIGEFEQVVGDPLRGRAQPVVGDVRTGVIQVMGHDAHQCKGEFRLFAHDLPDLGVVEACQRHGFGGLRVEGVAVAEEHGALAEDVAGAEDAGIGFLAVRADPVKPDIAGEDDIEAIRRVSFAEQYILCFRA